MTTTEVQDTFQMGRVLSRTFGTIGRNIVTFGLAALLLTFPILVVNILLRDTLAASAGDPAAMMSNVGMTILLSLLSIACAYLLMACLTYAVISDLNGEKAKLGTSLAAGFRVFVPVLIISILALIGMLVGLILLVVPGAILAVMWAVVVPVQVVERPGIGETFGRSRALTKGYRWQIFALFLLFVVVMYLVIFGVALAMGISLVDPNAQTAALNLPYQVASWLESVAIYIFGAALSASIYYELRTVKEGIAPQQLAAAFD